MLRFTSIFTREASDNANISIYPIGDKIYALAESPVMFEINKNNLNTEKKVCVNKYVSIVHHTSHPHVTSDGTVYNLGLSITLTGPQHNIIRLPPDYAISKYLLKYIHFLLNFVNVTSQQGFFF